MEIHLKAKYQVILTIIFILAACSSTNRLSDSAKNIHLPKKSIGIDRSSLANDMIYSVDQFIQRNLACSVWSLVEVGESKAVGQLVFTRDGQIYRGEVTEIWLLQQCGKALSLRLKITPGSNGGSNIRVARLSG